jgi:nucleotide-binding universal stress UspA family protein
MKILVAYDGSEGAKLALDDLKLAGLPDKTEALILTVAEGGLQAPESIGGVQSDFSDSWKDRLIDAKRLAETTGRDLQRMFPQWTIVTEARWGSPAKLVLEESSKWHAELIVAGSHGHSAAGRIILGSVTNELVHNSTCSVRIARPRDSATGAIRVLVAADGSEESDRAIRAVARRPWPPKTEARIVSVIQTMVPAITALEANTFAHDPAFAVVRDYDKHDAERLRVVAEKAANYLRHVDLTVDARVIEGDPRTVILEEAERFNASAIFVGARGLGRVERLLLGSVSTHILNHARSTVEVVR